MSEKYKELIEKVVKEEKKIVKKVAITTANKKVEGLKVDDDGNVLELSENGEKVFEHLYNSYKELGFGTAKIIIKKAIKPVLEDNPDLKVPEELRD